MPPRATPPVLTERQFEVLKRLRDEIKAVHPHPYEVHNLKHYGRQTLQNFVALDIIEVETITRSAWGGGHTKRNFRHNVTHFIYKGEEFDAFERGQAEI